MSAELVIVGQSPRRVDGLDKVTGAARYAADFARPGMLYGKIKRSPHAHARVVKVDPSRAYALPGVKLVLTVDNVPRVLHAGAPPPRNLNLAQDQYILDHVVRFVGDGVAAVAAVSEEIAEEALDLIDVEYELLPAVFDPEPAMLPGAPSLHGTDQNLISPPMIIERGDLAQGLAEADAVIDEV
jgi:xanthine dehydrogenase molybdenum-binding subunit